MLSNTDIIPAYRAVKALIQEPHRREEIFQEYLRNYPSPGMEKFFSILRERLGLFNFDNTEHIELHRKAIQLTGQSMQGNPDLRVHEIGTVLVECSQGGGLADMSLPSMPTGPMFMLDMLDSESVGDAHEKVSAFLKGGTDNPDYLSMMPHKDPVEILVKSWKYEAEKKEGNE